MVTCESTVLFSPSAPVVLWTCDTVLIRKARNIFTTDSFELNFRSFVSILFHPFSYLHMSFGYAVTSYTRDGCHLDIKSHALCISVQNWEEILPGTWVEGLSKSAASSSTAYSLCCDFLPPVASSSGLISLSLEIPS